MSIQNNKKALAEKLKKHLNSPEYVAVPDLLRSGDYGSGLSYHDGDAILKRRKFIDWEEHPKLINYSDLEPADWEEIIKLIKKRNQEREQNYQAKQKKIEEKVNSQPGLYYYYGDQSRNKPNSPSLSYGDKKGEYFTLSGSENSRNFVLRINNNHPVLDTFPYNQAGFYLIETDKPIERNDGVIRPWSSGGESNENNFNKWVEVGDQIKITPYEVESDDELPKKGIKDCDICRKNENEIDNGTEKWYVLRRYHGQNSEILHACPNCYKNKEQEYLKNYEFIFSFPPKDLTHEGIPFIIETIKGRKTDCYAGKKDHNGKILQQQNCSHCQPWKHHEISNSDREKIINFLISYFQENDIKKISLENGGLVITNNNNEIITDTQLTDNSEYQLVKNNLERIGKNEISQSELNDLANTNSPSTPSSSPKGNNNALIIGCIVSGALIVGVIIGTLLMRRKNKK